MVDKERGVRGVMGFLWRSWWTYGGGRILLGTTLK